jgi:hypothetical protein
MVEKSIFIICLLFSFYNAETKKVVAQAIIRGIFFLGGKYKLLLRIQLKGLFLLVTPPQDWVLPWNNHS